MTDDEKLQVEGQLEEFLQGLEAWRNQMRAQRTQWHEDGLAAIVEILVRAELRRERES